MSKNRTQKILIPKGTVDPNEDTLIEIPANIKELPIVVAKKRGYEQNPVSLERYSKNFEVGGNKYSMSENRSSTYSPRHPGSLRNSQVNTTQNDSIENTPEELNEAAFMTTISSNLESFSAFEKNQGLKEPKSNSSYQRSSVHSQKPIGSASSGSSAIGTNEPLEKSKRTSSTCTACTVSYNKSQQSMTLKPQDSKGAPIDLNTAFVSSSKRSEASVSFNVMPQNTVEKEEKEVAQTEDKAQSAVCLSHLFFKKPCQTSSNKRLMEDKEVHSDSSEFEEKESRHYHVSRKKKKSKCCCDDNESSSTGEDDSGDRKEKIKKMYKYSENVFDNIYVEQLKRQFAEAKRKLEEAVKLASITLKEMECRKCCVEPRSSSRAASICDSVPEREVSFIPSSSSSHKCRVSVPDLNEDPSRTSNRKENSWQKVESGRSDVYKNYEIYENIRTKRHDDNQVPKSKFQQDIDSDSPCPFLKIPNPDIPSPRLYTLSKDRDTQTEQKPSIDTKITTKGEKAEGEKKRTELGIPKCSSTCVTQSSNSLKFVKQPRGNFSDTDSLVEKNSSTRKMNN